MRKLSSFNAGQQHDMTLHPMAKSTRALLGLGCVFLLAGAWADTPPITAAQQATANSVAQKGVALSDLADGAPDRYTVKTGDTLWAISTLYLKSAWRWPELWGMNQQEVKNPHRIYPGQILVLERSGDHASLRVQSGTAADGATGTQDSETVRISPRARITSLLPSALPTLKPSVIGPFLAEPMIVDVAEFERAPHIVAGQDSRVVLAAGDKVYARGPADAPLLDDQRAEKQFRIYGEATPLKDPDTGEVLGYEAKFLGTATLLKSEERNPGIDKDGKPTVEIVSAAIRINTTRAEVNWGDRLVADVRTESSSFIPHAPTTAASGRILSIYGLGASNAAPNDVISLSGGKAEGVDVGTVFAIVKSKRKVQPVVGVNDREIRLPEERIGLVMVFRTFEHLSYGLILEGVDSANVGDRLIAP